MAGSRLQQRFSQATEVLRTIACPPAAAVHTARAVPADARVQQIHAAETQLLYENAGTGTIATVLIASVLAYAQSGIASPREVWGWFFYVLLIAVGRLVLARRYWRAQPGERDTRAWNRAFVGGAALAATGWGGAAMLFAPAAPAIYETFLVFVIGGVMLGGASLLAARPDAFLTFLAPTGLLTAMSLAMVQDEEHQMMGFLAVLFTLATIATTWRFHCLIASSLELRFDNHDLIESLRTAKNQTDALNRDLELRVRDRTARLTEADQRKDEFLATLAHELRNPLAAIRFAVENLKPGVPSPIAGRARDVIERQVRQLVRLVDDLLDVSRITANKMVLRREPHDLVRLMATAAESIAPIARAADQTLAADLPPTPLPVDGDGARLVQVFANILNNSVKFTPRGGQIWFTVAAASGEAVVRIRDTGIGIAPSALPRVFEMFHQADPVLERTAGGLGIGLTLARRLVEMHDGFIDITSPGEGQGTEVVIRLPLTTAAHPTAAPLERPAAAARALRVLIVEDNADAAEMLDFAISHLGHATRVVHDGPAAISLATEFAPHLILLDIGLPAMSGYTVAQALRGRPEFAHVHLAAITGWGQEEDRREAREAGFDSHFTKPLAPHALEELLATVAQRTASDDAIATPRTRLTDSGREH